jgi:hypothetical protein
MTLMLMVMNGDIIKTYLNIKILKTNTIFVV